MHEWLCSSSAYNFSMAYHCPLVQKSQWAWFTGCLWSVPSLLPCFLLHIAYALVVQITIRWPKTPCNLMPPRFVQVILSFESSAAWPIITPTPPSKDLFSSYSPSQTPPPLEYLPRATPADSNPSPLCIPIESGTPFISAIVTLIFHSSVLPSCSSQSCAGWVILISITQGHKTVHTSFRNDLSKVTTLKAVKGELVPNKLTSSLALPQSLRSDCFVYLS